jgi:alpha-L-fucosidase
MFDSQHTDFDIMATPFKRDIMREISDACRKHGLRIGWYHSIWDWSHPSGSGANFDEYARVLKAQVDELLTNYGPIDIMWFDGEWIPEWTEEKGRDLYEHIRKVAPTVIINNRVGKGRGGMAGLHNPEENVGDFGTPEQEIPGQGIPNYDWETCMTMNDTWGFKRSDHNWKSATTLVRNLIDTSSKGGNFLLNVGPTAEGLIPDASIERLAAVGKWLQVNGESIYGTSAGPFKRLEWGRCTRKGNRLYLHIFDWPDSGVLEIPGLLNAVTHATIVGDSIGSPLPVSRQNESVLIEVPATAPDAIATVIAIDIAGEPQIVSIPLRQREDGSITLRAIDADVRGFTARYEKGNGKDNIGFWTDAQDIVTWQFEATRPGRFRVILSQACPDSTAGTAVRVSIGDAQLDMEVQPTGDWTEFIEIDLGEISIPVVGQCEVSVEPQSKPSLAVMNLRELRLVPVNSR